MEYRSVFQAETRANCFSIESPPCQQTSKHFLDDDVGGEKQCDKDGDEQSEVGPAGLRPARHELTVVQTEEEAGGEEGEEATVEHLGDQDDESSVR